MPELPEVETVCRQLRPKIKGKTIKRVELLDEKVADFKTLKAKIKDVRRRAKLIIIELEGGRNLIIHLKMTGRVLHNKPIEKMTRAVFYLDKKNYFVFDDWRKFGYIKVLTDKKLEKFLEKFGPEPLEIDVKEFKELLKKRPRSRIKSLMLDQSWIAGIGNIYAQEACFCARIKPTRLVKSLKEGEIEELFKCLQEILKEAIKQRGSSVDAGYVDGEGEPGTYDQVLKIYNRRGKNCVRCQGAVKDVKLGGRSTRYCPKCQK